MNGAWRAAAPKLALLLLFALVIRVLPGLTRPATPVDHCERVSSSDVSAMERCHALRPDDIELMLDLAAQYEAHGHDDRAEGLYRRALAIDPADDDVRRRLDRLTSTRAESGSR